MAATIVGAPNIAAIPAATPIIKPQDTLPVKKPIPIEMMAKAAKALPALPVTIFNTLQIVSTKTLELAVAETVVPEFAKASDEVTATTGAIAKKKKDRRAIFATKAENFFIIFTLILIEGKVLQTLES